MPALSVLDVRRAVSRHRVLLAAGLAAGSLAAAMNVLAPHAPAGVRVLAADRDLAAGTALVPHDLRVIELPSALAPTGVLVAEADGSLDDVEDGVVEARLAIGGDDLVVGLLVRIRRDWKLDADAKAEAIYEANGSVCGIPSFPGPSWF